ncbi:MAG: hypothetical protein QNJ29_06095 [Rhizobiaceae bacterium]|nr:hypothetical protein [Rhizobiaceae bacterium]
MARKKTPEYPEKLPLADESLEAYGTRLEREGYELMYIRKALRCHYELSLPEAVNATDQMATAKLRHIEWLLELFPSRSRKWMIKKISGNCDVSVKEAEQILEKFERGAVQFLSVD